MSVIRWEEPPAEHGNTKPSKPLKFQGVADELRANPGRWAVVVEKVLTGTAGSLSFKIRTGSRPWDPAEAFEAKCIGPAGGKATVYARYVGEASDAG